MTENHVPQRRIALSASPRLLLAASGLSIAFGIGSAVLLTAWSAPLAGTPNYDPSPGLSRVIGHPWLSLLLGALLGLPLAARLKHSLRRHRDHHVEFSLLSRSERLRRPVHKPSLVDCVFVVAAPAAAGGLAYWLQIACVPAFFGPGVLYALAYPEQREIHRAAQARLAETV